MKLIIILESQKYLNWKNISSNPQIIIKCSRRSKAIFKFTEESERPKRARKKTICGASIYIILPAPSWFQKNDLWNSGWAHPQRNKIKTC